MNWAYSMAYGVTKYISVSASLQGRLPLEGVDLKLAYGFYRWPLSFFTKHTYRSCMNLHGPSTPSHERMNHDPSSKFSTL
jgi:hypothetical protein